LFQPILRDSLCGAFSHVGLRNLICKSKWKKDVYLRMFNPGDYMGSSAVLNFYAAWIGILGGFISGALIGLFFHEEQWAGGYASYRRRMLRLGHISFFGLGLVNFVYAATLMLFELKLEHPQTASAAFLIGAVTMPACCFLAAWRKPWRHLFPIPVISLLLGTVLVLSAWRG
jgi:hypothetical protein